MSLVMGLYQRWFTRLRYAAPKTRTKIFLGVIGCILFIATITYIQLNAIPKLSLIVVEEHHEALPYWLTRAEDGYYPRSGLTLIHIDGHSDEAPPEYVDDMPVFRWPKTDADMATLMQKNDVFVQAAIMSGLISRVIFIFPGWVKDDDDYSVETIGLGSFMHKPSAVQEAEPYFCECRTSEDGSESRCFYMNMSRSGKSDPEQEMPVEKCKVSVTFLSEHIVESVAAEKLREGDWVLQNESYILDIDEDFFGCESGAKPLVNGGIPWNLVAAADEKLNLFLCPRSIKHEELSDVLLKETIEILMGKCFSESKVKCSEPFDAYMKHSSKLVIRYFKEHPMMFCNINDLAVKEDWKSLAFVFYHMTKKHLYLLLQTGFCLNTSPASYGFFQGRGHLEICHGTNTPNETIVFLHSPNQKEIQLRMKDLQGMMSYLPDTPELITLCRSVRDGYTPRKHSMMIEWGIIRSLQHAFPQHKLDTFYDENLLGGRRGWYGRYGGYPPAEQSGKTYV